MGVNGSCSLFWDHFLPGILFSRRICRCRLARRRSDWALDINERNGPGETAFSFARVYNALAAAKLLRSRWADINVIGRGGGSPLDLVVCHLAPGCRVWLVSVGGKHHDGSHDPWPWSPRTCEYV